MSLPPFSKLPLTCAAQVALLQGRGMVIADIPAAEHHLRHLNYYRLRAYWWPFETDPVTHQFAPGTAFDTVLARYVFDRELRLLVLDAIERIEVSFRTQWAYIMAHEHGPHAPLDDTLAKNKNHWDENLESLKKEVRRSNEGFVSHFASAYSDPIPRSGRPVR